MVKSINQESGKINLSYKDCLGTWEENISNFQEGMTVKGIVRDAEKNKNGIFIELTPNLVGMTEYTEELEYGQSVDVCIKKILPEKKKVKLTILQKFSLQYNFNIFYTMVNFTFFFSGSIFFIHTSIV